MSPLHSQLEKMLIVSITAHVKYRVMVIVGYSEMLLLLMGSAHGMLKCGGIFSSGLARFVPAFSCVQREGGSLPPVSTVSSVKWS